MSTLLSEVENVAEGRIGEGEIDGTKREIARATGRELRTSPSVSNRLRSTLRNGNGLAQITGAPERLAAVDAEGLAAELAECAGHEVVTLLGDAEATLASLTESGLEARVMDWEAARDKDMQAYDSKRYKQELKERAKQSKE